MLLSISEFLKKEVDSGTIEMKRGTEIANALKEELQKHESELDKIRATLEISKKHPELKDYLSNYCLEIRQRMRDKLTTLVEEYIQQGQYEQGTAMAKLLSQNKLDPEDIFRKYPFTKDFFTPTEQYLIQEYDKLYPPS